MDSQGQRETVIVRVIGDVSVLRNAAIRSHNTRDDTEHNTRFRKRLVFISFFDCYVTVPPNSKDEGCTCTHTVHMRVQKMDSNPLQTHSTVPTVASELVFPRGIVSSGMVFAKQMSHKQTENNCGYCPVVLPTLHTQTSSHTTVTHIIST